MRSLDLEIPRQVPEKRPPAARRRDFEEIDKGLTASQAMLEARRCVQCAQPPCALGGCPLTNRIPEWINHVAEGRFREAWRILSLRNDLPEACGRLCPQEKLCESRCVVGKLAEPVAIGRLEEFIARTARRLGWDQPQAASPPTGKRVAIVGSGPAGLAAAEQLLLRGYSVVILERHKEPGGLLLYGIPRFKLDKARAAALVERVRQLGAEIRTGVTVGADVAIAELLDKEREGFDAVLLAIGATKGQTLALPGSNLKNIHLASDFLIAANLDERDVDGPRAEIEIGHTCLVFGGGDTASDCVRTALRLGFQRVLCVYRRSEKELPGRLEDRRHAVEEGVEYLFLASPVRFLGQEKVKQVECIRMRLGEPDTSGRARPEPIPGSEFTLRADTVVLALGYRVEPALAQAIGLQMQDGLVHVDEEGATSRPGVFAAGDVVHGADLIVTAVRAGRAAARGIHRYLKQR